MCIYLEIALIRLTIRWNSWLKVCMQLRKKKSMQISHTQATATSAGNTFLTQSWWHQGAFEIFHILMEFLGSKHHITITLTKHWNTRRLNIWFLSHQILDIIGFVKIWNIFFGVKTQILLKEQVWLVSQCKWIKKNVDSTTFALR